jgi:hypothetical protein
MMGKSSVASVLGTLSRRRTVFAESCWERVNRYLDRTLDAPILGRDPLLGFFETRP